MNNRELIKSLTCLYYRIKYRSKDINNSLLYRLKVTGGGKSLKLLINNSHVSKVKIFSKGTNNSIKLFGCGLYHGSSIKIIGKDNTLEIDENCALSNMNITIKGSRCTVKIGCKMTSNGTSIYCVGDENKVTIGNDCMFAADTEIWSSDSHTIVDATTNCALNKSKESVHIGNHVWLAEHAKVLKGVFVADDCILGMGCILTKDTEANSLYAGIPAKKVKSGINWKREN